MFEWTEGASRRAEVHRSPQAFLSFQLESHGLGHGDVQVAPRVVMTFQSYIYTHLVRLTSASRSEGWHKLLDELPVAHGNYLGTDVTVGQLPIGAPAAVLFLEQFAVCGARSLVAVGAAGSLQRAVPNGSAVLPTHALRQEGTSYHYQPGEVEAAPDGGLLASLREACVRRGVNAREGIVWTTDAPFREVPDEVQRLAGRDVLTVDMEASALFVVGAMRNLRVASLFIVSDELFHPWIPASFDHAYRASAARLAECALDAVVQAPVGSPTGRAERAQRTA